MSISVLVMGESGTGKSSSVRNLKADETYIISVVDKPLPFRNKYFQTKVKDNETIPGNLFISHDHEKITRAIKHVNDNRPDIKNIVIDDFQYIMASEFMEKATEKGYQKFTELAQHIWDLIKSTSYCRSDLVIFMLTHSEIDQNGKYKAKTIGKLLDEKITLEGLFTIVLHSQVRDNKYLFLTQNDGLHIAKSPIDMFKDQYIENDLRYVREKIDYYYNNDDDDIKM